MADFPVISANLNLAVGVTQVELHTTFSTSGGRISGTGATRGNNGMQSMMDLR